MSEICLVPTFGPVGVPFDYNPVIGFTEIQEFERDRILTHQGSKCAKVYWIESGVVKKVRLQPDGAEIIIGLRTTGWVIGASALLVPSAQQSTAITVTRCAVRTMAIETFLRFYGEQTGLAMHLSRMLAMELAVRLRANAAVRRSTVRLRLEQFLEECNRLAEDSHDGPQLNLKQTEIAQIVGSTPEHLSRLLHQMEDEGLLDRHRLLFAGSHGPSGAERAEH
jgi:CRP-like cAMP-binding protein